MLTADWWKRQKHVLMETQRQKFMFLKVHLNSPLCGLPPHRNALDWSSWRRLWPRPGFLFGANRAGKPLSFCPSFQHKQNIQTVNIFFQRGLVGCFLIIQYDLCPCKQLSSDHKKSKLLHFWGSSSVFLLCSPSDPGRRWSPWFLCSSSSSICIYE